MVSDQVKTRTTKLLGSYDALHLTEGDSDTLRWVVSIRFKVGLTLLALLLLGWLVGLVPFAMTISLGLVNLLYLCAGAAYWYLLKSNPTKRTMSLVRDIQIPEKLLLCTVALYFCGGVLSPVFILYPVSIMEAIILLKPSGVYRTGVLALCFYCGLALLEVFQILPVTPTEWAGSADGVLATPRTYALYVSVVSSILLIVAYIGNRVALVIRQRNRQIESQLNNLHTLYSVANTLGNMMDEHDMLDYLAKTLKSIEGAAHCLIALVDKDGAIELKGAAGISTEVLSKLQHTKVNAPGISALARSEDVIVIDDIEEHAELKQYALEPGTKSVHIFPIKVETTILGAITLAYRRIKPLSPEMGDLMATIATQAGLALQRAQLVSDAQRLANEMSQLYNLGLYTGSTLSKDEVIRRTSANIAKLMDPDAYYIALYDEVTNVLNFEAFVEHGHHMPKLQIPLDKGGVTSRIIQRGKPILVQDWTASGDKYNAVALKEGADMLSYLGVPMLWEDRVIGVLSVQCEEPMSFDLHDERLLLALAAQTAIALENAKLHQLAQDQGKLDSLTSVYNHGYFVELVRKAVADSDKDDTQVSLIMLDIDHFKHYNDSFGHVAGDNVLKMVAQALNRCVGESGAVGRWGGEEFGVLLLGIGITEAKKLARQIRRAISELSPVNGQGQVLPNPTISQGISSYPHPSATANDLIEEADTALYHAKKHGR
ncbi:MAG TPA: diguanylate cyclase, partial [Chloroflexia bacterium]|nr:diguanylate cyclase [Chloroflexia bacterium]